MIRRLALLVVFALAACAGPRVQPPLTPPPGFTGLAIDAEALVMDDGARLPLTRWAPLSGEQPWAVIVALHGVNDSRAAYRLAAAWWAERGIETWAFDQRGFGDAPGRGVWAGEARMVQDLRIAVDLARAAHPDALIVVAGESMGGAVAIAAFGSDRPPAADRVVLMAPAVWGWSSQAPLNRYALRAAASLLGDRTVAPPRWLAEDRAASDNLLELYRTGRDPASILAPRYDALYGLVDLMESATLQLGDVRVPTLLQYGAGDRLIEHAPMRRALERAGSRPGLQTAWYPNGRHLLNRDLQAERVYADVEAWLRNPGAPLPSGAKSVLDSLHGRSEIQPPR